MLKKTFFSAYRILCPVLCLIVILLTSCGKQDSTAEWMAQYEQNLPQIWIYGEGYEHVEDLLQKHNKVSSHPFHVVKYSENEISYKQFSTKLSSSLMTESGPDIVISDDPNLFINTYKLIDAGVLQSFDPITKGWERDAYYPKMLDGSRAADGQVYILPISIDLQLIATTENTMNQYSLTEDDFSNFSKTTDTLENLYRQTDTAVYDGFYRMTAMVPSVFDRENRETALLEPYYTELFQKWYDLRILNSNQQQLALALLPVDYVADGKQLFHFWKFSDYLSAWIEANMQKSYTVEQWKNLKILPMNDTDGKMAGEIRYYALFPKSSDQTEAVADLLNTLLFRDGWESAMGLGGDLWLSKHMMQESLEPYGFPIESAEALCDNLMALTIHDDAMEAFDIELDRLISKSPIGSADWAELERSINIYLSE